MCKRRALMVMLNLGVAFGLLSSCGSSGSDTPPPPDAKWHDLLWDQDGNLRDKSLSFELEYFGSGPRYPGRVQPVHSGLVVAADNEANLIEISLGADDGVKAGFQYMVVRGGSYIATLQINEVQARESTGYAVEGLSKGPVHLSDVVTSDPNTRLRD